MTSRHSVVTPLGIPQIRASGIIHDHRQTAALVPMPQLLSNLGAVVNLRTRRGPCPIPSHQHCDSNSSAFSWRDDGRWYCFSRGIGGDRIALVRTVKNLSFREAVTFLAALAGVEYRQNQLPRAEIEKRRHQQQVLRSNAETLVAAEKKLWVETLAFMHLLEAIQKDASRRLAAIHGGEPELWSGETDCAWETLAEVYRQSRRTVARYYCISFAPPNQRFEYTLDHRKLETSTNQALEYGFVADEKRSRFEVQW
jgi:hypothetical protein